MIKQGQLHFIKKDYCIKLSSTCNGDVHVFYVVFNWEPIFRGLVQLLNVLFEKDLPPTFQKNAKKIIADAAAL